MNTGMRRGELLALKWSAIDFKRALLTVEGVTAKSKQTRHLPLNTEALDVLKKWQKQAPDAERIFPVATSFKSAWVPMLVRANIADFRWHDLRHHFASRLASAGIPLNDIRELLGHATITMVLRYAHLSPDRKRAAVAALMEARAAA
jgi:integrase